MAAEQTKLRVQWYRSPVSRENLRELNKRSDLKGLLQTGGFLAVLALTGSAAYFSAGRLPWPVVVLLFFFHGTCWQFLINGFHELVHDSVFKTQWLKFSRDLQPPPILGESYGASQVHAAPAG
jgi:fatty acid desaturase